MVLVLEHRDKEAKECVVSSKVNTQLDWKKVSQ